MKDWARNRNVKRRARDGWKWSRVLDGGVPNGTDGRADRGAWSGVPNGADVHVVILQHTTYHAREYDKLTDQDYM